MDEKTKQFQRLRQLFRGEILLDEFLSRHTTFKIGGPADFYLYPKDHEDLCSIIDFCQKEEIDRFVIGNGSNLLVADSGFRGVVIDLSKTFTQLTSKHNLVNAGAGVGWNQLLRYCLERGLSGFEPLSGIPGQIGGCIRLNAGAFGVEIGDRLQSIRLLDGMGTLERLQRNEFTMEYRYTDLPADGILVEAQFAFSEGNPMEMEMLQNNYLRQRRLKQPLSLPSAGSVFKRPPGDYAGRLIEEAGCKGLRIGDAMVSRKHANFIVNCQLASAEDVRRLIGEVWERVLKRFDTELELEIHLVGFSAH
jgi:UDP-N-acetylmuramate dehydrogenase